MFSIFSMLQKYLEDSEHLILSKLSTFEQDLTLEYRPLKTLDETKHGLRHRKLKHGRFVGQIK